MSARWVPLHSEQDKEQSVDAALQFQQFVDDKKDDLFNQTVTLGMRHGSIAGHLNPKDRVWCHNKRQSRAGKAKIVESAGKIMVITTRVCF